MIKATIKLVLDGRTLSNGNQAVYLRITKNRSKKNISLGLQCKKEHFLNEEFTKHHPNYQIENEVLLKLKARALHIIRELQLNQKDFSLDEFEKNFREERKESDLNAVHFFDEIINEMERAGRMGNAKAYQNTRDSLINYAGKGIKFSDITPSFLEKYEVYLKERGGKNGGVAFRMREIRALYNKAIQRKIISKEPYPFETYKISKLKKESHKIALTIDEFKQIRDLDLSEHPNLINAYNFFMFSVYTRGMNFQDMMKLKWSNIQNERIYYTRSKTKGKLNLQIIPPVQEILDYYKAQARPTKYVFPILLQEKMTPKQIENRKHKVLMRYNKKLKEIAELAKVNKPLTSYVARHSFATILKMSGTPIEKISEMMGHTDVSITIAYLKEFSNEDLDNENLKLLEL